MLIGYARVSTIGQTLDAQRTALNAAGAEKVFQEKASGARGDRAELHKMLNGLEAGDVVIVTRLDRLARNTRDLLNIIDTITKAGAGFRSLADAWADTTTPHGRLFVTILSGLAEFERELILVRTSEGRERARVAGRSIGGRPRSLSPKQIAEIKRGLNAKKSPRELAELFGCSKRTVERIKAEMVE